MQLYIVALSGSFGVVLGSIGYMHYIYIITIKHRITTNYKLKIAIADYLADEKHFRA